MDFEEQEPLFKLEDPISPEPVHSDEQITTTSALAAFAQRYNETGDTLNSRVSTIKASIQEGGEPSIRQSISNQSKQDRISTLKQMQIDRVQGDATLPNLKDLIDAEMAQYGIPDDYSALEKEGVNALSDMSQTDDHQAAATANLEPGQFQEGVDNMKKIAIFNRYADGLRQEAKAQGVLGEVIDFGLNFIPGLKTLTTSGLSLNPAGAVNAQRSALWSLPLDQFEDAVKDTVSKTRAWAGVMGLDKKAAAEALGRLYTGISDKDYGTYNVMAAGDVAPIAGLFRKPLSFLLATGNRTAASTAAAASIIKDANGLDDIPGIGKVVSSRESVTESLPSINVPSTPSLVRPYVGTSSDIANNIENQTTAMEEAIRSVPNPQNKSTAQLAEAIEDKIKEVSRRFHGNSEDIADVKEVLYGVEQDKNTGIYNVNVYFGREADNGGFSSPEAAMASIERRGLSGADLYQNVDKQWFIRYKTDVPETNLVTPRLKLSDIPDTGIIGSYLKNASSILPDAWNESRLAGVLTKGVLWRNIYKPLFKTVGKLSRGSARDLDSVLMVGQADKKWYNIEELEQKYQEVHKRLPSDKEVEAYYAYKNINDANYKLENHFIYTEKARQGKETVQIGKELTRQEEGVDGWENEGGLIPEPVFRTGRTTGRVIPKPDFDELRVLDQASGKHYAPGANTTEFKRSMDTGQYHVIELERPVTWNKEPVKYVLVHKNSVKRSQLEYHQLGYIEGGNVENKNKYFVKQSVHGTFSDGKSYSLQPKTHISSATRVEAEEWAEKMQTGLDAYNKVDSWKGASDADIRKAVESAPWSGGSYEKFADLVESGKISKNSKFEVLFDKQLPEAQTTKDTTKWIDADESAKSQYYAGKGQMYYSHRGERLPDPSGQLSRIFNPLKTTQRAVNHAIRTAAFGDYNKSVIEDWSRTVSSVNGFRSPSTNTIENFFHGELNPQLKISDSALYTKFEAVRNTHKRFLNMLNPTEVAKNTWARKFAEFADDYGPIGRSIAAGTFDVADKNVLRSVQNFMVDTYLGFFNLGQFVVQSSTGIAAMAVHPIYGGRAAAMLPAWTHALTSRSEGVIDWWAKNASTLHGMKPDEWKTMVKTYIKEGWGNVGDSTTYLDTMASKLGGSMVGRAAAGARQIGRQPFYMAERFNRVIGFNIAWNRVRKEFPNLEIGSTAFNGKLRTLTDDLTMNMAGASKAAWQQGLLSIPATFQQYQAHMVENILPKALGGSRAWSGTKARLAGTQLLLFGVGGYGGVQLSRFVAQQVYNATGEVMNPDAYRAMSKGLIDSFINYSSSGELDTDLSSRVGPMNGLAQYFNKVSDGDQSSTLGVFLGPLGTFGGTAMQAAWRIGQYFRAEQADQISTETWGLVENDVLNLVKSGSYYTKAKFIWDTGMMRNSAGDPIVAATKLEGYAALLGIPLAAQTENFADFNEEQGQKDLVRDYGKLLAPIRNRALDALGHGDEETAKANERIISGILNTLRSNFPLQNQVIKELNKHGKYNNEASYNQLIQRMQMNYGVTSPYQPRAQ